MAPVIAGYVESMMLINNIYDSIDQERFTFELSSIKNMPDATYAGEENHSIQRYKDYWKFWKHFNINQYEKGLKEHIQTNYSQEELRQINLVYENGFNAKVLKLLLSSADFIAVYNELLTGEKTLLGVNSKRLELLTQLYNYSGLSILEKNLSARMMNLSRLKNSTILVTNFMSKKEFYLRPGQFESRTKEVKNSVYVWLANRISSLKNHELIAYLKSVDNSTIRSFNQLIINYHYLFVFNFILENEVTQKLIQKRGES